MRCAATWLAPVLSLLTLVIIEVAQCLLNGPISFIHAVEHDAVPDTVTPRGLEFPPG